jgi:G-patch domain/FHA domain
MDSEEGEIPESVPQYWTYDSEPSSVQSLIEEAYDPVYEWPGESSSQASSSSDLRLSHLSLRKLRPNQPSFRLLVLRTSILPSKHRLAVIDGYSEIQFGRDIPPAGSTTPRLRLKEMEVSKLHATAYWDASRGEWGVVDMGSMHGTFLQPATTGVGNDPGVRLSPPRTASVPRKLHHMDHLTIGGTTFLVHIHEDRLPCQECSPTGGDEIPLFSVKKDAPAKRSREAAGLDDTLTSSSSYSPQPQKDPKKALTMLKQSLLTRHEVRSPSRVRPASPSDASAMYLDRSARRRALHASSQPDAPGVSSPSAWTNSPPSRPKSPDTVTSQPPTPLPSTNIGHRLLMKQGWEPGTALGTLPDLDGGRIGLVEPLDVTPSLHRVGLGVKRPSTPSSPSFSHSDWKERAKRKRWEHDIAVTSRGRGIQGP